MRVAIFLKFNAFKKKSFIKKSKKFTNYPKSTLLKYAILFKRLQIHTYSQIKQILVAVFVQMPMRMNVLVRGFFDYDRAAISATRRKSHAHACHYHAKAQNLCYLLNFFHNFPF